MALSVFVLPGVWAASAIDVDRKDCSVEFSVGGDYKELNTNDLSVKLYQVASVDKAGAYTPVGDFSGLDLSALSYMAETCTGCRGYGDRQYCCCSRSYY